VISLKKEQIENSFSYHTPNEGQTDKYNSLRNTAKNLAYTINVLCPESREKSTAITKLEECLMWANKSIAVNE